MILSDPPADILVHVVQGEVAAEGVTFFIPINITEIFLHGKLASSSHKCLWCLFGQVISLSLLIQLYLYAFTLVHICFLFSVIPLGFSDDAPSSGR
jgi:hypothetical protein